MLLTKKISNKVKSYLIFVLLFFCFGAGEYPGNMEPFPEEQLAKPIYLKDDCAGVVITEWQGIKPPSTERLSKLCNLARQNFACFINSKGINTNSSERFIWRISFIPIGSCYRCLNDTEYRFYDRAVKNVWGYTSYNHRYTFVLSEVNYPVFERVFLHELFHAMSIFYGVFDNNGVDDDERISNDEWLAYKFADLMVRKLGNN